MWLIDFQLAKKIFSFKFLFDLSYHIDPCSWSWCSYFPLLSEWICAHAYTHRLGNLCKCRSQFTRIATRCSPYLRSYRVFFFLFFCFSFTFYYFMVIVACRCLRWEQMGNKNNKQQWKWTKKNNQKKYFRSLTSIGRWIYANSVIHFIFIVFLFKLISVGVSVSQKKKMN